MSSHLHCSIALPAAFRPTEILAFHRRDPQAGAEMVGERELHKGLVWDGAPAGLSLRFDDQRAVAELSVDGAQNAAADRRLAALLRRMLGLTQPVEDFERQFAAHPRLGPLIARQSGLRVAVAATPFEALSWAIIGQQISVSAAVAIRRRLIQAVGLRHSAGLLCYPGARELAQLSTAELRRAGCSATKAASLLSVAALISAGELPLDTWADTCPADEIRARLLAVRGIGPWTVNYTLLRGFGWPDGSLHGDVAVRRGLQLLLGRPDKIDASEAEAWLAEFTPWRALVAAHLWALKADTAF